MLYMKYILYIKMTSKDIDELLKELEEDSIKTEKSK